MLKSGHENLMASRILDRNISQLTAEMLYRERMRELRHQFEEQMKALRKSRSGEAEGHEPVVNEVIGFNHAEHPTTLTVNT